MCAEASPWVVRGQNLCVLPSLTGHVSPGPEIRSLFGLPARLGGLGIRDPSEKALEQRDTSRAVTRPVVDQLLEQNEGDPQDRLEEALAEQSGLISRAKRQRAEEEEERQREVVGQLSPSGMIPAVSRRACNRRRSFVLAVGSAH